MNSKFDELKKKNAAAIQQMEKATNMTIVDSAQWTALINIQKTQSEQLTALYSELQNKATQNMLSSLYGTLSTLTDDLDEILKAGSASMAQAIAEQTEALSTQVGKQNEQFALQMNNLKDTTSDMKKKLIPLLIGIPTAVQVLFLTAYILLEIYLK